MQVEIIKDKISRKELAEIAQKGFGTVVKLIE